MDNRDAGDNKRWDQAFVVVRKSGIGRQKRRLVLRHCIGKFAAG